jgi:hypothetical protein
MHQARSLFLQRGEPIVIRCKDSTVGIIWITAAADVSVGGFLTLPPLTSVGARGFLREGSSGGLFSSSDEGDLITDVS